MSRKKIGFLVNHLVSNYTAELCRGAVEAAKNLDADIFLFCGSLMNRQSTKDISETQLLRNVLYEYSTGMDLDAVVIALDGIKQSSRAENFAALLRDITEIPCIFMESSIPGQRCLMADQDASLREMMEHLIVHHGYREIGCIRGPLDSSDAEKRCRVYRECMEQYGLPCGDDYVEVGRFDEESGELIRDLMEKHPHLEAVVCSNDFVAIRAQDVLRAMGYRPGVDVAVVGCDNIEDSRRVIPSITTIAMDVYSLGYESVIEANRLADGLPQQSFLIPSRCVFRESCGCHNAKSDFIDRIRPYFPITEENLEKICREVCDYAHGRAPSETEDTELLQFVRKGLHSTWMIAEGKEKSGQLYMDVESTVRQLRRLNVSTSLYLDAVNDFGELLGRCIEDPQRRARFLKIRIQAITDFIRYDERDSIRRIDRLSESSLEASALSDAAMHSTELDSEMLRLMAQALRKMHIRNGHVLIFPDALPVYDESGCFCKGDRAAEILRLDGGQVVPAEHLDELEYRPLPEMIRGIIQEKDKGEARMVFVLQSEEEQFGLFICSSEIGEFANLSIASYQMGSALRFAALQHRHYLLEQELHGAVHTISEKNEMLQKISEYDALTKIYNRRGLIENFIRIAGENTGRSGMLLYMDLDNLKQINDRYGHKAGDFAISSFANIICSVLRRGDIVGRIGGDEFLAIMVNDRAIPEDVMRGRIEEAFREFNRKSGKPYYVEASIGFHPFIVDDKVDLENLFDSADQYLYLDKMNKRKDIDKKQS